MLFRHVIQFFPFYNPLSWAGLLLDRVSLWLKRVGWVYAYLIFLIFAPFVEVSVAHAPLAPKRTIVEAKVDNRAQRLESFLKKYNSPLAPHADTLVAVADRYGYDWRFLPAIAGTESTFGLRYIPGTYNPFGWGGGKIPFPSWEYGIEKVGKTLWVKYLKEGKRPLTIDGIGATYAASPHWPSSVKLWMRRMGSENPTALVK